jgi:hypothetical protein
MQIELNEEVVACSGALTIDLFGSAGRGAHSEVLNIGDDWTNFTFAAL